MYRAVTDAGFEITFMMDDMDAIDITALELCITQQRDAVWEGLGPCPRTCLSAGALLCNMLPGFGWPPHEHARSLLDILLDEKHMVFQCSALQGL